MLGTEGGIQGTPVLAGSPREEVGANSFPPAIGSHREEESGARSDALFIAIAMAYAQQLLSLLCLQPQDLLGCHLPVLNQRRGSVTRTLYHTRHSGLLQISLLSCTPFSQQFPNTAFPFLLYEGFFFPLHS